MKRLIIGLAAPWFLMGAGGELPKEWKVHESKEGGFEVALPGLALETKQVAKTGLGTLEVTMLLLESKKDGAAYLVSFAEFPEGAFKGGDNDKRLDAARAGAVASAKGKLKTEKKITLGKHPGRELLIENDKGMVRTRIYAVDQKLYQTVVSGAKAFVQGKDAERFFESFKLK
jgi:hypothetical protein